MPQSGRLLTPDEVAEMLATTRKYVMELSRQGVLPGVKVGKSWRYRPESIERYVRASEAAASVGRGA